MDRNNQLFMKSTTDFSFNVCFCDWQLTADYLNSPAVTSTHLAPCSTKQTLRHFCKEHLTHLHQQVWFVYQHQMAEINFFWQIHSNCRLSVSSGSLQSSNCSPQTGTSLPRTQTNYLVSLFTSNEGSVFAVCTNVGSSTATFHIWFLNCCFNVTEFDCCSPGKKR